MAEQFISPNWHVMFVHFPLGLLIAGAVIEFFSFLWRRSSFRTAGRWMILLGALSAIPTAMLGVYALREVAVPGSEPTDGHWHEIVQQSPWNANQWEMMEDHAWMNSVATGLFAMVAVVWLGATEAARRSALYWALWIVLLAGVGLVSVGAWHSGEAVYRYGTAVSLPPPQPASAEHTVQHHGVDWYVPPLQLHVLLAGIAVALAVGAIGLSIKRWDRSMGMPAAPVGGPVGPGSPAGPTLSVMGPGGVTTVVRPVAMPGRFWVLASLVAILAAVAGVWSVGGLTGPGIQGAFALIKEKGRDRLLYHVAMGVAIIVLPLLLALVVRFTGRARFVTSVLMLLFVLAVAAQVWLGILMLYDSQEGPLQGFAPAGAATPMTMPTTRP